ncbi:MAG TPA: potassium channel family protein, partial [Acidimicrobiales bacterium]|nr:potassium channel family protein [Acidimicrobiales bacterium]
MDSEPPAEGSRPRRIAAALRKRPPATPATAISLSDLDPSLRRPAMLRSAAIIGLSWVLIFGAYFALPIGRESGLRAVLRLGLDIALIGAVLAWQVKRISVAELPELRAVEALGIIIAVFLVAFSAIYLSLSHETPGTFTQTLDHARALYLTITVFSTVGFGDITPRTDASRLIVSAQMLLDLAIIGVVVRLLFNAAKSRVAPADGPATTTGEAS